ncbi:MAG: response regulator [Verrucomicrobiales bacterium]|nr:response regulator [Verrucomicrobiales bacterium]
MLVHINKPWKSFWGILSWMAAVLPCLAAPLTLTSPHLSKNYILRLWEDEDKFPRISARSLAQTPDGFIWVGTFSGLFQLNGTTPSTRIPLPKAGSGEEGACISLLGDQQGRLWIGTEHSLLRKDGAAWTTFPKGSQWEGGMVFSLKETADGTVFFGTSEGIYRVTPQGPERENVAPRGTNSLGAWILAVDQSNTVWARVDDQLIRRDRDRWITVPGSATGPTHYSGIAASKRGGVWVSERHRLTRRMGESVLEEYGYPEDFRDDLVTILEDRRGQVWVGGFASGLLVLQTNGHAQRILSRQGLPHNHVASMLEDVEGNIFLGTGRGGLLQLTPRRVNMLYADNPDPNDSQITAVSKNPKGELVFATANGEVFASEQGEKRLLCRLGERQTLRSLLCTREGEMWLGTEAHGILRFKEQEQLPSLNLPLENTPILLLHQDSLGSIWIGTEAGNLKLDTPTAPPRRLQELDHETLIGVAEVPNQGTFVATRTNLRLIENGRFRILDLAEAGPDPRFIALAADPEGGVWLSLNEGGLLWRRSDGTVYRFDSRQGLPELGLEALLWDDHGRLWTGTSIGLVSFELSRLKSVASGKERLLLPLRLTREDGLARNNVIAWAHPGSVKSSSGQVCFATIQGIASIETGSIHIMTNKAEVILQSIEVDGQRLPPSRETLIFPPGTQRVRIHYTTPTFSAPERVLFEYRLAEPAAKWRSAGDSRSVELLPMGPGSHRVEIRASNGDQIWSQSTAEISFTIRPFFWQTWLFRILVGLVTMTSIGAWVWAYQYRRNQEGTESLRREKMLAEERTRMERQLRQSQKMEALGTLAGGIAHDFNNILTAISGNTQLAISDLPSDHPVQVSLAEVKRGTRRAADLVRQILTFSRQEKQTLECIALEPIVTEALQLLRINIAPSIHIETRFTPDSPLILADPSQIHQIILNLGTNAAQAIGRRSGLIQFEQTVVDSPIPPQIKEDEEVQPGRFLCLRVKDTGSGMDRETMERVFDPFFTTKGPNQGTGLGLSVVHGIMQRLGGSIHVESQLGLGTTFTLLFPVALRQPSLTPPAPIELRQGHGEQILVVDDEESIVFLTTRILKKLGYRSRGFRSPEEALAQFKFKPYDYAAVITDLSMPNLSGPDLARQILMIRPDIPIILTTGYIRPEEQDQAEATGIRYILLKPNTVSEMGQALSSVLQPQTQAS